MPKKSISLRDFKGGLVFSEHGQDNPQFTYAGGSNNDVNRKKGILGLSGAWKQLTRSSDGSGGTATTNFTLGNSMVGSPGRGLFYFQSDYDNMHGAGGSNDDGVAYGTGSTVDPPTQVYFDPNDWSNFKLGARAITNNPTEYYFWGSKHDSVALLVADVQVAGFNASVVNAYELDITKPNDFSQNGFLFDIHMGGHQGAFTHYDSNGANFFDLNDLTHPDWAHKFFPVYYQAQGGIRICDGSFMNQNTSKLWIGYIHDAGIFSHTERKNGYVFKADNSMGSVGYGHAGISDSNWATVASGNRFSGYGAKIDSWVIDRGNYEKQKVIGSTGALTDTDRKHNVLHHGTLEQPQVKSIYAITGNNVHTTGTPGDINRTWLTYNANTSGGNAGVYSDGGGGDLYCMADFGAEDTVLVGWNFFGKEANVENTPIWKNWTDNRGSMGFTWKLNGIDPDYASYYTGYANRAGDTGFRRPGMTWFSLSFRQDGLLDIENGGVTDNLAIGHGDIYLPKGSSKENPGWVLWMSYLYENGQESQLTEVPAWANGPGTNATGKHYSEYVHGKGWFSFYAAHDALTRRVNPRVRGYRVYLEQKTVDPEADAYIGQASMKLLCEVDYFKGIRGAATTDHDPWIRRNEEWHFNTTSSVYIQNGIGQAAFDAELPGFTGDTATGANGSRAPYNGNGQGHVHQCWTNVRSVGEETFETIHGYTPEDIGACYYKTAVVTNGRAYVGNVKFNGVRYPDRMMKSQVGEYDVFTSESWIDVTTSDADSVVHLAAYGDKILQFKENAVHVIDISKEYEFLVDSSLHNGVRSPCQVTTSEAGIFWANRKGLYQFDGERIVSLFQDIGFNVASAMPTINETTYSFSVTSSTWSNVFTEETNQSPVVTYDPFNKNVIIMNQGQQFESHEDVSFVWNIDRKNLTQLFSTYETAPTKTEKSNAIINRDGVPVVIQNSLHDTYGTASATGIVYPVGTTDALAGNLKYWDHNPNSTGEKVLLYESNAIDFGNHSQRKSIYSINFTYKADGTTALVPRVTAYFHGNLPPKEFYLTDSDSTIIDDAEDVADSNFDGVLLTTSDKVKTRRYTHCLAESNTGLPLSIRSQVKKVTAIKIALVNLSGVTIHSSFELEDISITFKDKTHK